MVTADPNSYLSMREALAILAEHEDSAPDDFMSRADFRARLLLLYRKISPGVRDSVLNGRIQARLSDARKRGFIEINDEKVILTTRGRDVVEGRIEIPAPNYIPTSKRTHGRRGKGRLSAEPSAPAASPEKDPPPPPPSAPVVAPEGSAEGGSSTGGPISEKLAKLTRLQEEAVAFLEERSALRAERDRLEGEIRAAKAALLSLEQARAAVDKEIKDALQVAKERQIREGLDESEEVVAILKEATRIEAKLSSLL